MMYIVDFLTDFQGKEACCASMIFSDECFVLLHGNEERHGRTKGKEMVNLEYKGMVRSLIYVSTLYLG